MTPSVSRQESFPEETRYLSLVLDPIKVCARYKPRFGRGNKDGGLSLSQFQTVYEADAFYNWFGLNNPLMYAAHKAAGGITSVYRQIGIGCERLFRTVLKDSLGLSEEDVRWSYAVPRGDDRSRNLHLDGRVPIDSIVDPVKRERFLAWMKRCADRMEIESRVFKGLAGTVFEVRQGYKSKDSKRQNADLANGATAYTKGYLPCAVILSTQIDQDVLHRYRTAKWTVLTGITGTRDSSVSTYDFLAEVIGYDLAGFFRRNHQELQAEVNQVLQALLAPEGP